MEERRKIERVEYPARGVIVVCDTQERIFVKTTNVSPLGMGIQMAEGAPDIVGKDVIIVAETLIMYADVIRQEKQDDGSYVLGIKARKFTDDVLSFLFEKITAGESELTKQ